jgi:hypothetical protein
MCKQEERKLLQGNPAAAIAKKVSEDVRAADSLQSSKSEQVVVAPSKSAPSASAGMGFQAEIDKQESEIVEAAIILQPSKSEQDLVLSKSTTPSASDGFR